MGCHNQPDGEQLGRGGDNLPTDEVSPEPNDAQSERSATKVWLEALLQNLQACRAGVRGPASGSA